MNSLDGKDVCVYLDGGWKVEGLVVREDRSRLVLRAENVMILFKEKINIVEILDVVKKQEPKREAGIVSGLNIDYKQEPQRDTSGVYGMTLPSDLLTKDFKKQEADNDLSISFSNAESGINFRMKDEPET